MKLSRRAIATLLVAALCCGVHGGVVFQYANFCDQDHLNLLGDATKDGFAFAISPGRKETTGSLFVDAPVAVMNGFTSTFVFSITDTSGGGADGFAFVIQTVADRLIGNDASAIGYGGMKQAVILEFDTYQNDEYHDPSNNHISLHYKPNPATIVTPDEVDSGHPQNLKTYLRDGKQHTVVVTWSPATQRFSVTIDSTVDVIYWDGVNLAQSLGTSMGTMAYVGFTAGAGGRYESHNLHSWSFDATGSTACISGFDSTNNCLPIPSKQDCTVFPSCGACVSAVSCCGWCGRCAPLSDKTCSPNYTCSSSTDPIVWWGIGIVIAVLILCAIALFVYWRRTRVKRRFADPTLLPSDNEHQTADNQYSQL